MSLHLVSTETAGIISSIVLTLGFTLELERGYEPRTHPLLANHLDDTGRSSLPSGGTDSGKKNNWRIKDKELLELHNRNWGPVAHNILHNNNTVQVYLWG